MTAPADGAGVLGAAGRAYRLLWRFVAGRRRLLGGAAALLLGAELLRLPLPWFAGEAVNALQRGGSGSTGRAGALLLLLFGVVAAAWVCHAAGRVLERNCGLHARAALMEELLDRLLRAPLAWHRREPPLETAKRTLQGTEALNEFAQSQYIYLQSTVQIIGPVLALGLIDPVLGLAAALGLGLLGGVSLRFDRRLLRLNDARNAAERANHAAWGSLLGSMLVVRAFRLGAGARALARQRLEAVYAPLRREVVVNELKWGAVELLGTLLWMSLVALHVWRQPAGQGIVALGTVYMVYEYARRAEACLGNFAADVGGLAHHVSGLRVVEPLLEAPRGGAGAQLNPTPWARLELCGTGLDGEPGGRPVLADLRLVLQRGRRYALTGPSGAGKTTLLAVLSGLEHVAAGSVLLDGRPVGADDLRAEATWLVSDGAARLGSVRDLLAPGGDRVGPRGPADAPNGGADDDRLWDLLGRVGLDATVRARPRGLDSPLDEGDLRWSAGEQQRLELARGFLAAAGSSLLLADEPTSHLDAPMARRVMRAVLDACPGACVVVALHDDSFASMFDELIVVDRGRIVRTVVQTPDGGARRPRAAVC